VLEPQHQTPLSRVPLRTYSYVRYKLLALTLANVVAEEIVVATR
jgi:hypothetical protein